MARKVFISFLGYSDYGACHYSKGDYKSESVRYVQEATLGYINTVSPWTKSDAAYILLTKGAESKNWVDNGHTDFVTKEVKHSEGLETRLSGMGLPLQIVPVKKLPDGNNEEEIMQIFQRVFSYIEEGDELYFDLTHGFRYLPMLVLVLGNYAKFLRNVKVKSITYGNFEGRNKEKNEAQLIDLCSLTYIQDWTFAAANFLENGNVSQLASLSETVYRSTLKETNGEDENAQMLKRFTDSLKGVVSDFQTCRGMNIYKATNIGKLLRSIEQIQNTEIKPLDPVIERIKMAVSNFSGSENVVNGFAAAKWCVDNGLYQQAATILQENVVSCFALRHGIRIDDENQRGIVNKALIILFNNIQEDNWEVNVSEVTKLKEVLNDELLKDRDIINGFNNLTEVRNDLNHSGMRSKRLPLSATKIEENIVKCIRIFEDKLAILCC